MPSIVRQFEPHITRIGGAPSKYRFSARCSECHKIDTYEANKAASDDAVKGFFKDRGWLLGRNRSYDLCSTCLAKPARSEQPLQVAEPRRLDPRAEEGALGRSPAADKRHRDTAEILARHLGKPDALAAEVFRPHQTQPPRSAALDRPASSVASPALTPQFEQVLTGMAADLKGLRSAMEQMVEQIGMLVALGGQQIEAVARLAPLVIESAEGISSGLRDVVSAVRSVPPPPPVCTGAPKAEEQHTREAEATQEHVPAIRSEPEPHIELEEKGWMKRGRRSKTSERTTDETASLRIVVKSIADAKRLDRFYTSIRLPRKVWDSAGFGPEDRLLLQWSGKTLRIDRAAEGGVKPKSIGETFVILQSWKLGNLNLDQPKVVNGHGYLRLTPKPLRL